MNRLNGQPPFVLEDDDSKGPIVGKGCREPKNASVNKFDCNLHQRRRAEVGQASADFTRR